MPVTMIVWLWRSTKVLGTVAALAIVAQIANARFDRDEMTRLTAATAATKLDPITTGSISRKRSKTPDVVRRPSSL